jgi:hypothetical protein
MTYDLISADGPERHEDGALPMSFLLFSEYHSLWAFHC